MADYNFNTIIKHVDFWMFQKVAAVKRSYFYLKYLELLNNFQTETKVIVNHAVVLGVVFAPMLIALLFLYSNSQYRKTFNIRKNIYQLSGQIIDYDREIQLSKSKILADASIMNGSDFDQLIKDLAMSAKVKLENLQVQNFKTQSAAKRYTEISAEVTFSNLSISELTVFMQNLILMQKMKIVEINITKDLTTEYLKGRLLVTHFSDPGGGGEGAVQ